MAAACLVVLVAGVLGTPLPSLNDDTTCATPENQHLGATGCCWSGPFFRITQYVSFFERMIDFLACEMVSEQVIKRL